MKLTILTASLHLIYICPVMAQALSAGEPHIIAFQVHAIVHAADGYKSGELQATVKLSGKPAIPLKISFEIKNEMPSLPPVRRDLPMADSVLSVSIPMVRPKLWSSETPVLYTVSVRLSDSSGRLRETEMQRVGFREVEVRDSGLLVNGVPVWVRGAGRPAGAQPDAEDSLLRDLQLLKQFNVNAVRAGDYPGNEDWARLCDEYGLYIIDDRKAKGWAYEELKGNAALNPGCKSRSGFLLGPIGKDLTASKGHPSPAVWEMKKYYQSIRTVLNPVGWVLRVYNAQSFRSLSDLSLEWELWINGKSRQKGLAPVLAMLPGQSGTIRLPVVASGAARDEVILTIRYKLRKKEVWAPAGFVVASEQFLVRKGAGNDVTVSPDGELTFKDEGGFFTVSSPVCNLQFNKQTGWLQRYVVNGNVLMEEDSAGNNSPEGAMPGLSANFWRAPTDQDRAAGLPALLAAWKHSTREPRLQLFSTSTASDIVIVKADYSLPETQCALHVHYTVNAHGELQVQESMEADTTLGTGNTGSGEVHSDTPYRRPMLPRYGMKWILPAGFDSITYYGRGPFENYEDRNEGAEAGVYRQTVEEQFYPYTHPQETGTKTGVRWWKITNKEGHGLLITADSSLLSMSALHYYDSDLENSWQGGTLKPRPQTALNIDYRQMGVGGGDLLKDVNYTYEFKVTPL